MSPDRDATLWHSSYIQTHLERDVRSLRDVGDVTQFQSFLRALAARAAGVLNLSDLARDVGIAVNTAKAWLSVLEATFQVIVVRPYFANVSTRLVKAPKVYFLDTGLLAYLVGLRDPAHAAGGPMKGALFENLVVADLYKSILHTGQEPRLYFWRTQGGHEVDLLVERPDGLVPLEIKATMTPRPEMALPIRKLRSVLGEKLLDGLVVHAGTITLPLAADVVAVPFRAL